MVKLLKNQQKVLEDRFNQAEWKNIVYWCFRIQMADEHWKSWGNLTISVRDVFSSIPEQFNGNKLLKKSCLRKNNLPISENNLKSIQRLVFEIFLFKIGFLKHLKICHVSFWRLWKNGRNFRRNETVKIFRKSKAAKLIFSVIFNGA